MLVRVQDQVPWLVAVVSATLRPLRLRMVMVVSGLEVPRKGKGVFGV
jgi:hypothetical protein